MASIQLCVYSTEHHCHMATDSCNKPTFRYELGLKCEVDRWRLRPLQDMSHLLIETNRRLYQKCTFLEDNITFILHTEIILCWLFNPWA